MIRVQNLVKTFGSFTAVNDVSFNVAEGEIFAFLGPNGAGKTTTIKMLTTLLKPTSGHIELDGLDPRTQAERGAQALRHRLSGPQPGRRLDGRREHGDSRRALPRAAQDAQASAPRNC